MRLLKSKIFHQIVICGGIAVLVIIAYAGARAGDTRGYLYAIPSVAGIIILSYGLRSSYSAKPVTRFEWLCFGISLGLILFLVLALWAISQIQFTF